MPAVAGSRKALLVSALLSPAVVIAAVIPFAVVEVYRSIGAASIESFTIEFLMTEWFLATAAFVVSFIIMWCFGLPLAAMALHVRHASPGVAIVAGSLLGASFAVLASGGLPNMEFLAMVSWCGAAVGGSFWALFTHLRSFYERGTGGVR